MLTDQFDLFATPSRTEIGERRFFEVGPNGIYNLNRWHDNYVELLASDCQIQRPQHVYVRTCSTTQTAIRWRGWLDIRLHPLRQVKDVEIIEAILRSESVLHVEDTA